MADGLFNVGKVSLKESGTAWDDTADIRHMLVTTGYTFDPDQATVDNGTTSDLRSYESSGTGYTPGYNSTSRIALGTSATRTVTVDNTNNRAILDGPNSTFSSIDVGAIGGLAIIRETATTSDTGSVPLAYFDSTTLSSGGVTTNGGDFTITWSTAGIMQSS